MHNELKTLLKNRTEKFFKRVCGLVIEDSILLDAEYSKTQEVVPFKNRLNGEYRKISEGEIWGKAWDNAWFHLAGSVSADWEGKDIAACLDFGGESLIFSDAGEPLYALTHMSVFNIDFNKKFFHVIKKAKGDEKIDLWVEVSASCLMGVDIDLGLSSDSPLRTDSLDAEVLSMKLCVFDMEMWHLQLDIEVLISLMKSLPDNTPRRGKILRTLNRAIDAFNDDRTNVIKCREILKEQLSSPANGSSLTAVSIGHAHIDTGWLWPVKESIRKTGRTFASQMALIDKYPDYVFGASQPQHYVFLKEFYPGLYKRLKEYVKDGSWEVQGGMWVEADCNLINGESMVRQILYGKNFFKDEFDIDVNNLWLPDVFGYSAALPQILKKSGIDYFLTSKISWNQFNRFPHHTFIWEGIDGSDVLSHFVASNTYNGNMLPEELIFSEKNFTENDVLDEFLSVFGIGDGGGGPAEEYIERGLRQKNLEGCPKVKFEKAQPFFDRLGKKSDLLERWSGELYLELHRGTLTTQGKIKKGNRKLENCLKILEFLYSTLDLNVYPKKELEYIWKKLLINQFHDILPGSSITKVYDVTRSEYEECFRLYNDLLTDFAEKAMSSKKDSLVIFNPLSYTHNMPIDLGEDWLDCDIVDEFGNAILSQDEENNKIISANIPSYSFLKLYKTQKAKKKQIDYCKQPVLENDLIKYSFSENGEIISAFDKETDMNVLKTGNVLSLYEDRSVDWDAWDIDIFYENQLIETALKKSVKYLVSGPVRSGIQFVLKIGQSEIIQNVYLASNTKRLDFETSVDWKELHKMLRVSFDTTIRSSEASFDIQYGYVKRNTHRNTSWDMAKFESAAHKYVDLSDYDYGVALMNDCKYGHKVLESKIDLNILRSPTNPDPNADRNEIHTLTYSLLPHRRSLIESDVIQAAGMLNIKPVVFYNKTIGNLIPPCRLIDTNGISLEVIKKAEKEKCYVIRVVETKGKISEGTLAFKSDAELMETNLIEWENNVWESTGRTKKIKLNPFEIKTYKLNFELITLPRSRVKTGTIERNCLF